MERRELLGILSAGTAGAFAGCMGGDEDVNGGGSPNGDGGASSEGFAQAYDQPWRTDLFDPNVTRPIDDQAVVSISEYWKVLEGLSPGDELYDEVIETVDWEYNQDPSSTRYEIAHHPFEDDIGQDARIRVGSFDVNAFIERIQERRPEAEHQENRNGYEILAHEGGTMWAVNSEKIIISYDGGEYIDSTMGEATLLSDAYPDFDLAYDSIPEDAYSARIGWYPDQHISVFVGGNRLGENTSYISVVFESEDEVDEQQAIDVVSDNYGTDATIDAIEGRVARMFFEAPV